MHLVDFQCFAYFYYWKGEQMLSNVENFLYTLANRYWFKSDTKISKCSDCNKCCKELSEYPEMCTERCSPANQSRAERWKKRVGKKWSLVQSAINKFKQASAICLVSKLVLWYLFGKLFALRCTSISKRNEHTIVWRCSCVFVSSFFFFCCVSSRMNEWGAVKLGMLRVFQWWMFTLLLICFKLMILWR